MAFYGIGFRIDASNSTHPRAYSVWQGMLKRCYDVHHVRYNVYGGSGVIVSKRWHCFDTFISDMSKLAGWNEEDFNLGLLQLDKDYTQRGKASKIYSRKTCAWVSRKRNNRLQPSQQKRFRAISPDGTEFKRLNKAEFCRSKGLSITAVSKCLNGHRGSHKGWKFYYIS